MNQQSEARETEVILETAANRSHSADVTGLVLFAAIVGIALGFIFS
jgi:hypothetical protein